MATNIGEFSRRDLRDSDFSSVFPKELLWEDKSRTLRELISSYRLPLAVKLKIGDINKYFQENSYINSITKGTDSISTSPRYASCYHSNGANQNKITTSSDSITTSSNKGLENKDTDCRRCVQDGVILQIHETRKMKIILARKMTWDKSKNDYVVTGEQLEIPASIKGWLELVPEDGRPVEYFDTIGGIASIKPKRFLVRTSTVGYQLTTEENGNSCWMPQEIKPGEVLTTGIIYMDSKKNKHPAQKNIFKRLLKQNKVKKEQDLKYLQCFDSAGVEIMIPLIMAGVFSPVGDSSFANHDAVYEFQDLILAFSLPVNAQLVHVNAKESFQCPRGVIRLYGTREEEYAIVSKIGTEGNMSSEVLNVEKRGLPIDSELMFSRGIIRKKTNIHSTTVNNSSSSCDTKIATKNKQEREIKNRDLSMDKLNYTFDQRSARSLNDKPIPTTNKFCNAYVSSFIENTEMDRSKVSQHTEIASNEITSSMHAISLEPNTLASSKHSDSPQSNFAEQIASTDVELPEKTTKEQKSRSSSILEKLSVRKVKKERAKLKDLRSDDVFTRRISRSELSYQDFFNGLDDDGEVPKDCNYVKSKQDDSGRGSSGGTYQSTSSNNSNDAYFTSNLNTTSKISSKSTSEMDKVTQRRANVQKRDLPPIPVDSPTDCDPVSTNHSINVSKESLYEHLPPAPKPPQLRRASDSAILDDKYSDDEDGYMLPRQALQESRYVKRSDVHFRHKPPGLDKDTLRISRARKSRSELPNEFVQRTDRTDSTCPLDIDDLFNFTYSPKEFGENRLNTQVGPTAVSMSHLHDTPKVPEWRSKITGHLVNTEKRFVDNLNLETRGSQHSSRHRSRQSKNMNSNPNATIRSHNLRILRPSAKEIFPIHDIAQGSPSFQEFQNSYMPDTSDQEITYARPRMFSSRSTDTSMMSQAFQQYHDPHFQHLRAANYGMHYVESEPCFRHNSRAFSVGGNSDVFLKQGDDSAISLCSRGEAGHPNDSEYSYNVYTERAGTPSDGWTPPNQIEELSVSEVSKSLWYIGMKDRVVLRFSKEQIDGHMLCTLDEKLLKEGFPELNGLEVKKIMDFIRGWRPKKT